MKFTELDTSTQIILKVIFAGLALWLLWALKDIALILILALILASAMEPLTDYLQKHKIPRTVSVIAVYVIVFGIVGSIIYLMIPPVIEQFKHIQQNIPDYTQALQARLGWLLGDVTIANFFKDLFSGTNGGTVLSSTFGVFDAVLSFIAVLVISFYLVAEETGMKRFVESLVPPRFREVALQVIKKIQHKIGMWVLGQFIVSLGIFLFSYIGLLILHVPYALVLALVSGLFEIVPYLGPFLSAIPALLIAFIQAPILAVWVAVLYLLVHEVEGYVLVPKIMEKTVGTSPLVVMFALLIGLKLAGMVGVLISVPLVGALMVVIDEFWPSKSPEGL